MKGAFKKRLISSLIHISLVVPLWSLLTYLIDGDAELDSIPLKAIIFFLFWFFIGYPLTENSLSRNKSNNE